MLREMREIMQRGDRRELGVCLTRTSVVVAGQVPLTAGLTLKLSYPSDELREANNSIEPDFKVDICLAEHRVSKFRRNIPSYSES